MKRGYDTAFVLLPKESFSVALPIFAAFDAVVLLLEAKIYTQIFTSVILHRPAQHGDKTGAG
jgi:hypothetical protein